MHIWVWLWNYVLHLSKWDFSVCSSVSTKSISEFQSHVPFHGCRGKQCDTLTHSRGEKKISICSKVKTKDTNKRYDEDKSTWKERMLPALDFAFSSLKLCSWRTYSYISFWLCKEIARSPWCEQLIRFLFSYTEKDSLWNVSLLFPENMGSNVYVLSSSLACSERETSE